MNYFTFHPKELKNSFLDYAVARALGYTPSLTMKAGHELTISLKSEDALCYLVDGSMHGVVFQPSHDPAIGAPLIWMKGIATFRCVGDQWAGIAPNRDRCYYDDHMGYIDVRDDDCLIGETALIAGCRALVLSVLGTAIQIPEVAKCL